jgi:hypothetical protein
LGNDFTPKETNTHQDHVIAHVLGTTVLGYFVFDETLFVLLDIGFVWTVFLDGEMGLLPHPVAVSELDIDRETKSRIAFEIDVLLRGDDDDLQQFTKVPLGCLIEDVSLFATKSGRRLAITAEQGPLNIETSLATGEIVVTVESIER